MTRIIITSHEMVVSAEDIKSICERFYREVVAQGLESSAAVSELAGRVGKNEIRKYRDMVRKLEKSAKGE